MNKGMMWFDDNKSISLEEKISRAADYYKEKYGLTPDLCFTHAGSLDSDMQVNRVQVKPHKFIRPQHFWIGKAI